MRTKKSTGFRYHCLVLPLRFTAIIFPLLLASSLSGQSFGTISQSLFYADLRNPALPPTFWRNSEAERFNVSLATSLWFNPENQSRPNHQLLGLKFSPQTSKEDARKKKSEKWLYEFKGMFERNEMGAVSHMSGQVGGRLRRLLTENEDTNTYLSMGFSLGGRSWVLRDVPHLRPWDFGDPLLAASWAGRIGGLNYFLTPGASINGKIELSPDNSIKEIHYFAGFSSEVELPNCERVDCFTFSTPLTPTDFTTGNRKNNPFGIVQVDWGARYVNGNRELFIGGYWREALPQNQYGFNAGVGLFHINESKPTRQYTFGVGRDVRSKIWRCFFGVSGINCPGNIILKLGAEYIFYTSDQLRPSELLQHFSISI